MIRRVDSQTGLHTGASGTPRDGVLGTRDALPNYKWHPIEPLSKVEKSINLAAIRPLYESWRAAKAELKQSSPGNLELFTQRLVRRLSVETGILERLYDLDRGTTEALVADGFAEELVSRTSTDIEPSRLIEILRDQEAAVKLVVDCVAKQRPLSKAVIHELHLILTDNQDTTTAIDSLGRRMEIPLLKGKFKEQPNNPKRPDGSIHEYAPPVQVDSEVENLLEWLSEYSKEDPIIVSAWLHHRFTQIHPFQDGNGRVARALTTLVLLRADLLPLVIDRDLRIEYLKALEAADFGDLAPLAMLFARLERAAILQALSIDADAQISQEKTLTAAVIQSLENRFAKRKEAKNAELRRVNRLAVSLRSRTRRSLERALNALKDPVSNNIAKAEIHIGEGGPDRDNAHWYKYEVVKSGAVNGKAINFGEDHYFVKASFRAARERLIFVTSFHHVGRELSGIMEVTAFAHLESFEDSDDRQIASQDFFPCSLDPFVITWKTKEKEIEEAFDQWLDSAVAIAIKEYGDRL